MAGMTTCRLCGQEPGADQLQIDQVFEVDGWDVTCRMCGACRVTMEADLEIRALSQRERSDLASWVREQSLRGRKPPTICSSEHESASGSQVYRIDEILETLIPRDISARFDRILENLAALAREPGERCGVGSSDAYVCYALSPQQMDFHLQALAESGWDRQIADGWYTMMVTPSGWKRVGELQSVAASADQAFVGMSFKPSLELAWRDGLYKGIKAAKYRPHRIDKEEHNEKICDRIISEIRRSAFLVADVTRHRQGVYFEAGYAMGLGMPVIWTCQKREIKRAHFDTRQYNQILWESPGESAKALEHRIRATIGDPHPGATER